MFTFEKITQIMKTQRLQKKEKSGGKQDDDVMLRFTIKKTDDEDDGCIVKAGSLQMFAAFDGCGGMGGRQYQLLENRTSAYIASHLYSDTVQKWFMKNAAQYEHLEDLTILKADLESLFHDEAIRFKKKYLDREPSSVVGSMARTLPSTAVIAITSKQEKRCAFFWAGDSRGYLLSGGGLRQITQDDLATGADALENLYSDSAMKNYLNADVPFTLHEKLIELNERTVIVVATDGVFSGLPTPMHFEALLLDTLAASNSIGDWENRLNDGLRAVATDDVTLLLHPFGFENFKALKAEMKPRGDTLNREYITPCVALMQDAPESLRALWKAYREEVEGINAGIQERL